MRRTQIPTLRRAQRPTAKQRECLALIAAGEGNISSYRRVFGPLGGSDNSVATQCNRMINYPECRAYLNNLIAKKDAVLVRQVEKAAAITLDKFDEECARHAFQKNVKASMVHARYLEMAGKRAGAFKSDVAAVTNVMFTFDVGGGAADSVDDS